LQTAPASGYFSSQALFQGGNQQQMIQASLIQMLQQKCQEMAQLADHEVVKQGETEQLYHQAQDQTA